MNAMRYFSFLSCFFWFSLGLAQEPRTWTAASGKTVTATMIGIEGETVLLRREGRDKIFRAPLSVFSKPDQDYVRRLQEPPNQTLILSETITGPILGSKEPPEGWTNEVPLVPRESMKIEVLDEKTYRLATFGTIQIPDEYMFWHVANLNPAIFRARVSSESINLTFLNAAPKQTQRQWILRSAYNSLVNLLQQSGFTGIRSSAIDLNSELPDKVKYALEIRDGNDKTVHFVTEIQFDSDYTKIYQATAQSKSRAINFLKSADTFKPSTQPETADPKTDSSKP